MFINHRAIDKILERSEDLPSIPNLASQLIHMMANPDVDMDRLSQLIGLDPLLSLKVLKWVNSAHFSPASRITSLQLAVNSLGLSTIRFIIMGVAVFNSLNHLPQNDITNPDEFWLHSIRCAIAAKHLAERLNYEDSSEAYLVGLLHDIGKVALFQCAYNTYLEVILLSRLDASVDLTDIELEVLGFAHTDVSALLFMKWQLGEKLAEVVAAHHHPETFTHIDKYPLACILYLANRIAYIESSIEYEDLYSTLSEPVLEGLRQIYPKFSQAALCDVILSTFVKFESCEDILDSLKSFHRIC